MTAKKTKKKALKFRYKFLQAKYLINIIYGHSIGYASLCDIFYVYKDFDCEYYFHSTQQAKFIFQFQIQSAFDKEKLSTESLLKLQTYFGFSWILGCLAFGFIVILKPRGCQITKLYLCIFSLIICGFCCFLADFVQGVSH